jgi:hypothetical protein
LKSEWIDEDYRSSLLPVCVLTQFEQNFVRVSLGESHPVFEMSVFAPNECSKGRNVRTLQVIEHVMVKRRSYA